MEKPNKGHLVTTTAMFMIAILITLIIRINQMSSLLNTLFYYIVSAAYTYQDLCIHHLVLNGLAFKLLPVLMSSPLEYSS